MLGSGPVQFGLVVVDVDPRAGGTRELFALEQQYGKLPETVEVLTGGGGRHLYFLHPGGTIKNLSINRDSRSRPMVATSLHLPVGIPVEALMSGNAPPS
jgi:hypothetical protein